MAGSIDILNSDKPKRVLVLASNPTVSAQTGWPIGFWWAEVTHPYWEFTEHGYQAEVASPEGGQLEGDRWSHPRDESKYSGDDLISLGFLTSPAHAKLVAESKPLADVRVELHVQRVLGGEHSEPRDRVRDLPLHRPAPAARARLLFPGGGPLDGAVGRLVHRRIDAGSSPRANAARGPFELDLSPSPAGD